MKPAFVLNEICDVLDTYKGRDKLMRTLCYTCKLIGCITYDRRTKDKLNRFGSIMSKTRATLRLFDDLSMLRVNLEYGLGECEPDKLMQTLGLTSNFIDTIFYPIEKVSWLAENDFIEKDGTSWDVASTLCWVGSVYLGLIRSVRQYSYLNAAKACASDDRAFRKLSNQQTMEFLTGIRLILDLIHSISCLPQGFLWASQLQPWQAALVGTLSSVIGFYQLFARRSQTKCY